MGRHATGVNTCETSVKITISELLKSGILKKNRKATGTISWKNYDGTKCEIRIDTCWNERDRYIRLIYQLTQLRTGEKSDYDYKILLELVPSNLGKGEAPYFICPESGKRCRILYMSYGSHTWKSREAYSHRLYYRSQISSKMNYANDRYWAIDRKLAAVRKQKYLRLGYDGKPTRKAMQIKRLKKDHKHWDFMRWQPECMPLMLRRLLLK